MAATRLGNTRTENITDLFLTMLLLVKRPEASYVVCTVQYVTQDSSFVSVSVFCVTSSVLAC